MTFLEMPVNLSDIIAALAFVLSVWSLIWQYISNRSKIAITIEVDFERGEENNIVVANVGAKPLVVHGIDFYYEDSPSPLDYGYFTSPILATIQAQHFKKYFLSGAYLSEFKKPGRLKAKVGIAGRKRKKTVTVQKG